MRFVLASFAVLLFGSMSPAVPTTQPATPSTQPAADVLLIPFAPLGDGTALEWAGKAVHQNLMTDFARANLHVATVDKPIENTRDAQTAAKAAGAKYIVTGTYQVADMLVRFNGQILDTATGNVTAGFSATGPPRDLFAMEDSLSSQAVAELTQPNVLTGGGPARRLSLLPNPALNPTVVVQIINPPAVAQTGVASNYQGSALQQYVDSNRTPSEDYYSQVQDSENRETFDYDFNNYYGPGLLDYGGVGGGGFGGGFGGYGLNYSFNTGGFGFGRGSRSGHESGGGFSHAGGGSRR